jgi:hypothetical protein
MRSGDRGRLGQHQDQDRDFINGRKLIERMRDCGEKFVENTGDSKKATGCPKPWCKEAPGEKKCIGSGVLWRLRLDAMAAF